MKKTAWVIIVIVIVILVWWFFIRKGGQITEPSLTPTPTLGAQEQKLLQQSSSDEIQDIDRDLRNTDFNNTDKELADIERALSQ